MKNKFLSMLIAAVVATSVVLGGCGSKAATSSVDSKTVAETKESQTTGDFAGGKGTVEDPYKISSAKEFNNVRNDLSANYILTADIDLGEYEKFQSVGNFTPLSSKEEDAETPSNTTAFSGSFNGNNHTISNAKISDKEHTGVGVFGCLSGTAVIKDLKVENINVEGGKWAGGVIGFADYGATIKNITLQGENNISGNFLVGGIVGASHTNIVSCTGKANMTLYDDNVQSAGIIVGGLEDGNIEDCHVTGGTVTATGDKSYGLGGLAGCLFNSEYAKDCTVENVTIKAGTHGEQIGGLAGFGGKAKDKFTKVSNCTVKNVTDCKVTDMKVSKGNIVGSILGYAYNSSKVEASEGKITVGDKTVENQIGGNLESVSLDKLY